MHIEAGDANGKQPNKETKENNTPVKENRPQPSLLGSKAIDDNCPQAPAEVLRTCAERHARGLMHPSMLAILTHRQVTLPVVMEDDNHRELPSIHHFYRPIRQNVYAILYNMHHHRFMAQKAKEEGAPPHSVSPSVVQVSEWIYSRVNPGKSPELVPGVLLEWPVPTVQRLWFGTAQDDKCRRMRAFLSCMRSDTPLMLNTSYVPQHLLILAAVLRYIMTSQIQILRRQELDAFLATAFSTDLMNALHLQEMTVNGISSRGVQLAALVMSGVECALLANDACGAPVPWLVAAPWLYIDGKLLQRNLQRAAHCKHLMQLCDKHLDTVVKVERMRKAILEGLEVEWAAPPLCGGWWGPRVCVPPAPPARLEVAGVVVGQWGAATYTRQPRYHSQHGQVVGYTPIPRNSYGGRGWGRGRGARGRRGARGQAARGAPTHPTAGGARPARPATIAVNGKTVKPEEIRNQVDDEDNATPPADGDNNALPSKSGKSKNAKKNAGKGKKKMTNQKTEAAQPEANGPIEKNKMAEENLVSETEHIGQGDAPVSN